MKIDLYCIERKREFDRKGKSTETYVKTPVKATIVDLVYGMKGFVFEVKSRCWKISELLTGYYLALGETKAKAIEYANDKTLAYVKEKGNVEYLWDLIARTLIECNHGEIVNKIDKYREDNINFENVYIKKWLAIDIDKWQDENIDKL